MSEQAAKKDSLYHQQENPSIWDRTSEQQSGYHKRVALEIIDQLHQNSRLDNADYDALYDGLCEIKTLRDRDDMLEELWPNLVMCRWTLRLSALKRRSWAGAPVRTVKRFGTGLTVGIARVLPICCMVWAMIKPVSLPE